jgi:hypothetical protein
MTAPNRNENILSLVLVAPAFLYLSGLLVSGYRAWDGLSALGFLLVPILLLIGLVPLYGPLVELFGFVAVGVIATLGTINQALGGAGLDFAAGLLLASPIMLGAWAWTPSRSAPARLLGLGLALLDGLMLLSTLHLIAVNTPGSVDPVTLFFFYTITNILQACGLAGFLNVAPSACTTISQLPLRDIVDPVFVLLAGVALLGVLVPILSPRTARGGVGESEGFREFAESSRLRADLPVSQDMVRGLARRTPPRTSPGLAPPGSGSLLAACFLVVGFVAFAIDDPAGLLFPTMIGLLTALCILLVVSRPARAVVGLPGLPGAPLPPPPLPGSSTPALPAPPAAPGPPGGFGAPSLGQPVLP